MAYGWVHQAAHLLANHDEAAGPAVRAAYHAFLATVATEQAAAGPLAPAVAHFLKVTASYGDGLFQCYEVPDMPRTNNDLERCFGSVRSHKRRVTGRRSLPAGLVVRGSVRALAGLTAGRRDGRTTDLRLIDRRPGTRSGGTSTPATRRVGPNAASVGIRPTNWRPWSNDSSTRL